MIYSPKCGVLTFNSGNALHSLILKWGLLIWKIMCGEFVCGGVDWIPVTILSGPLWTG